MRLAVGPGLFLFALEPARLQKVVRDVLGPDPAGLALDVAEQPVRVVAELVVGTALLGGAPHAARAGLFDLDVGYGGPRGLGGRGGGSGELLDVQGYGREANHLARHPADALEGEAGLDWGGDGFVLDGGCQWDWNSDEGRGEERRGKGEGKGGGGRREMTYHNPFAIEVSDGLVGGGGHCKGCK